VILYRIINVSLTEKKSNTPDTRKSNYRIHDSAEERHRSAAKPCDEIKLENTNATPVKSTNHRKNKRDSVNYHIGNLAFLIGGKVLFCIRFGLFLFSLKRPCEQFAAHIAQSRQFAKSLARARKNRTAIIFTQGRKNMYR
jgi:hypothetical protein